jgi:hypothetical protein
MQVARVRRRAEPRNSYGGRLLRALAAHWLDRNPLRRTIDRIEVVAMLVLVVVFLAVAPVAATAASDWGWQGATAAARLERATWHPVPAVVVRGVPPPSSSYGEGYRTRAPVRWTRHGTAYAGLAEVAAGTPTGATVRIWTSESGTQTGPPLTSSQIAHQAALAGVLTVGGFALLVIVSALVIRRILDSRRMAAWDAGWSATGPQWCEYR